MVLHKLMKDKEQIDKAYGPGLNWEELEGYRTTSIRTEFSGGYNNPEEDWPKIIAEDLECTKRFISALKGPVSKLK